jgi:hypothetical protein
MVVSGSSATLKCSQITLLKSARSVSPVSAWITFHMRKLQRINGTELWHNCKMQRVLTAVKQTWSTS